MPEPEIPLKRFSQDLMKYDPLDVVLKCTEISRKLFDSGETIRFLPFSENVAGFHRPRQAILTHHGLAAVVGLAIRNYCWAGIKPITLRDLIATANNWNNIEDPFLGSGGMTLVRIMYEQGPYQEKVAGLIPRYLTILTGIKPVVPTLDIPGTFQSRAGISIQDFVKIGVAFMSAAGQSPSFTRAYLEDTKEESLREFLTPEKIDSFLKIVAADFPTFRSLHLEEEKQAPGTGKWVFNPLQSRPVILLLDNRLCVPVIPLLIHRITKGIYYDLMEAYHTPDSNPFLEWFGHAFQEYGGTLLRQALDQSSVFSDPQYGKSAVRGPDWVILEQDLGIAMEFRSSRLPKKLRTTAERDGVMDYVRTRLGETAERLPHKIKDILDGSAGLPAAEITEIVPVIVTPEPWYPEALMTELIQTELKSKGVDPVRFQLMSIEDLEWLLTWAQHESPAVVLRDKLSDKSLDDLHISGYLHQRAEKMNLPFPRRILGEMMDDLLVMEESEEETDG